MRRPGNLLDVIKMIGDIGNGGCRRGVRFTPRRRCLELRVVVIRETLGDRITDRRELCVIARHGLRHEARHKRHHQHTAVLRQTGKNRIGHVARHIGDTAGRRMRPDHRRLRHGEYLTHHSW